MQHTEQVESNGLDYVVTFEYTPATKGSFDEPPEDEYYEIIEAKRKQCIYELDLDIDEQVELLEYEQSNQFNEDVVDELVDLAKWRKKYLD